MKHRIQSGSILGYTLMAVSCLGVALWLSAHLIDQTFLRVESAKRHLALASAADHLNNAWYSKARAALQSGSALPYETATAEAGTAALGQAMVSFSLSDYVPLTTPAIFSSHEFGLSSSHTDGLGDLWHVNHSMVTPYALAYNDRRGSTTAGKEWSTSLREVPVSQLGLAALSRLDLSTLPYPVSINGAVLLPWGATNGTSAVSCSRLVSTTPAPPSVLGAATFIRPGLAVGYPADIYSPLSPEGSSMAQSLGAFGTRISWNGHDIESGPAPAGIDVQDYSGERRLVVDLTLLPLTNARLPADAAGDNTGIWVIDCTSPLAKSRGVVLVGDNGIGSRARDLLITNGAVRLVGQHGSPLAVTSSYGAVIFDSQAPSPVWNAHLTLPVRGRRAVASTLGDGAPIDASTPGEYSTDTLTRSVNAVEIKATAEGTTTLGFTGQAGSTSPDLFIEYLPAIGLNLWAANEEGVPTLRQSIPHVSAGQVEVSLRYERAANLVTAALEGSSITLTLPPGTQPRFETAGVCWSAPLHSLSVIARAGGASLYSEGAVITPVIQGLLVGDSFGGTISGLTIAPTQSHPLLSLTERAIIIVPQNAL